MFVVIVIVIVIVDLITLPVILRPKAEESLANARNVRVPEKVSGTVSEINSEILRR